MLPSSFQAKPYKNNPPALDHEGGPAGKKQTRESVMGAIHKEEEMATAPKCPGCQRTEVGFEFAPIHSERDGHLLIVYGGQ